MGVNVTIFDVTPKRHILGSFHAFGAITRADPFTGFFSLGVQTKKRTLQKVTERLCFTYLRGISHSTKFNENWRMGKLNSTSATTVDNARYPRSRDVVLTGAVRRQLVGSRQLLSGTPAETWTPCECTDARGGSICTTERNRRFARRRPICRDSRTGSRI